eukprot:15445648-Alexandrium_andersonii.AAC.1
MVLCRACKPLQVGDARPQRPALGAPGWVPKLRGLRLLADSRPWRGRGPFGPLARPRSQLRQAGRWRPAQFQPQGPSGPQLFQPTN